MEKEIKFESESETQWNSILKKFGIFEKKIEKKSEKQIENNENLVCNKLESLNKKYKKDDLDALFDEIDEEEEKQFEKYRLKRLNELKKEYKKKKFGEVMEITKQNYVDEINKAGNIWVILHVYTPGNMLCNLINQHLSLLAIQFKTTKFLKSIVDLCIPNFPEDSLPAIFIYYNGELKKKFLGPDEIGNLNLKCEDLEWTFFKVGAIESELECDPKEKLNTKNYLVYTNE